MELSNWEYFVKYEYGYMHAATLIFTEKGFSVLCNFQCLSTRAYAEYTHSTSDEVSALSAYAEHMLFLVNL